MAIICDGCGHKAVCKHAHLLKATAEKVDEIVSASGVDSVSVNINCKFFSTPTITVR